MSNLITLPPDLVRGPAADVLPLAGEANWGVGRLFVDDLGDENDGRGIIVGVVDTGIDATHPDLRDNVKAAKDFTGSSIGARDRQEHGTHVSGTIGASNRRIGVAFGCKLVHGKGLGDDGSGLGSWIAAAMRPPPYLSWLCMSNNAPHNSTPKPHASKARMPLPAWVR